MGAAQQRLVLLALRELTVREREAIVLPTWKAIRRPRAHQDQELCDGPDQEEPMKRCVSEEDLALHASGDLGSAVVAAHIQECEDCRRALAEFQLAAQFFADGFADPSEEELRAVRLGVRERLHAEARRILWKRLAAVAASLALAASVWLHQQGDGPSPQVAISDPPRLSATGRSVTVVSVVHHRRRRVAIKPGIRNLLFSTDENGKADKMPVVVLAVYPLLSAQIVPQGPKITKIPAAAKTWSWWLILSAVPWRRLILERRSWHPCISNCMRFLSRAINSWTRCCRDPTRTGKRELREC